MFLMFALYGCLPYDGLDASELRVVNTRFKDCSVTALAERGGSNDSWEEWFRREQQFDEWGNMSFDWIYSPEGTIYQLEQSFRGQWLDSKVEVDNQGGESTRLVEEYTWDGVFLIRLQSDRDEVVSVTDYRSDGVDPYNDASLDRDGDGEVDMTSEYTWSEAGIVAASFDNQVDGTIDASISREFDEEGRPIAENIDQTGMFQYREWEWAGPHDNLLRLRDEQGEVDGPSSVYERISVWDGGWTSVRFDQVRDGQLQETTTETYDSEGRLLTRQREFPGNVQPARETWTWDCPE